ncbi:hypothetical protein CMV_029953 [Castanea mollissima]|uniref:Sphingomyelin phosphodiesterase 4 n=1 Tax=Castanea mollissima TaxID=60419 RepID=A0A8J4UYZ7_9ROSI|nr:hypothetical protein CMV_029953 [Castanea mollissima]
MLPHSYTVDSQSKSQDLASSILSSTSSSQIISTCSSIDSFLLSHSPDQTRHFFSLAFPPLISKLFFGLTDSSAATSSKPNPSNGWIDSVLSSNDPDSANAVFSLLSPSSILFHSISAVDRLSLVKYVFPIERLPEWTRFALSSNKFAQALSDLSPLFNSKLKHDPVKPSALQIQLNVFEYYLFWFAYYPICKSNSENSDSISIKRARKFRLENWTSSIPGFSNSKRGNEQRIECNLYLRLLYAYLRAFVPIHDLNAHQPYRSSLLHYASGYDGSVTMRAEFVVNAFVHFWLVDNDFSPLPVNVLKSHGVSFPFRSVIGDTPPPASGLGEVVKLFVKYLNLSSVAVTEDGGTENCGNPRWRVLNSGSFDGSSGGGAKSRDVAVPVRQAGSWNAWIQRPLYRFILRTFLFCPVGSSIKNASEVFDVWITYMEPWTITWNDFAELDAIVDGVNKSERKEDFRSHGSNNGYSPSWQGYVLSNYLYYSSLVMHFIGFAHKFLHSDVEIIVRMVSKVMNILTSSKELVDLIKNVDTVFHSKQAGSGKSMLNSLCRFVPSIREQLQDWEDGLCESDADGSFLHENWNKDLRLFSNGEDGGQQLLQLFILRAEAELQAISGDNLANNLKCLDSLKAQVSCLFGGHTVRTLSFSPEPKQNSQSRDDIFKPRRVGNHASLEIKYRGDWMKRPISDDEVAWLAKLLVRFSAWLNESLGLNQAESSPAWSYVEVSTDVANVCGPTETMRAVLCAISSWLLTLAAVVVRLMKSHGLRVNLRMLASKKVVMFLLLSAVFSVVKKAFGLFHSV